MKIIMVYDQTQSGLGTKDDIMVPLIGKKEPIGPAVMMEPLLNKVGGHVIACLCCGNGTFLADPEKASRKLCVVVNELQPDMVMCGPVLNFADYAGMCAEMACDIDAITKVKVFAATSIESKDTIAAYKDKVVIVETLKKGGMGLNNVLKNMCTLAKILADGSDTAELEYKFCFKQRRIYRMWGMTAAWRMVMEGIIKGAEMLKDGGDAGDAAESVIREVEDFPYYKSVGYGGLPNEEMEVKVDATLMDGNTLDIGAVAAIRGFANSVSIARRLGREKVNSLPVAEGVEKFAYKEGFECKNMLADRAKAYHGKRLKEMSDRAALQSVSGKFEPYSGHDTVGMTCLDMSGKMTAATSTSGLFMKKKGRVGDSPISGSGFYADSKKGTASTMDLGGDLMKDCIPYEIVRLMGEGMRSQKARETAVTRLGAELKERRGEAGDLPLIAMNPRGEWGVATNIEGFSFTVVTEVLEPTAYLMTRREDGLCIYEKMSDEWMENYMKTRMASIEE